MSDDGGLCEPLLLPIATLLGAIGIALGSVTPAHADVIQCGDVLGPGGRFKLEHDLDCSGSPGGAVTIRDGAILDLQGHIVACPVANVRCIILTGTGAQLLNGAVEPGLHEIIVLEGNGRHTVWNVTSTFADANIVVRSDHNQLINVYAASTINSAFIIVGNHNRLTDNIAHCPELIFSSCVVVHGYENRLIDNFATSTTGGTSALRGAFEIGGNNNVLRGNRAIMNEGQGIVVRGTGNSLTRNTALTNSTDLVDTHEDCDASRWQQNIFRTSRVGATASPACIQ